MSARSAFTAPIRQVRRRAVGRRTLHLEPLESRQLLATFTVSNLLDGPVSEPPFGVPGSLRSAIHKANTTAGKDTIVFDPHLSGKSLYLTQGQMTITDDVIINATSLPENLIIDAQHQSRHFDITGVGFDRTSVVAGLTLTNGNAPNVEEGGAIRGYLDGLTLDRVSLVGNSATSGGGIYSSGHVALVRSIVSGNRSDLDGGGVLSRGLLLNYSQIIGNTSGKRGGGVHLLLSTSFRASDSTISDNTAAGAGGGVYGHSTYITRTMVSGNRAAGYGGGIAGGVSAFQSTISGNSSGKGGGGVNAAGRTSRIVASTVSGNMSFGPGGGIFGDRTEIVNSTITGNSAVGNNAHGGGVYTTNAQTVSDSTIVRNQALGPNSTGGGLWFNFGGPFRGSLIAENTAAEAPDLYSFSGQPIALEHSLIGNNSGTDLNEAQAPDDEHNLIGSAAGKGVIDPRIWQLAKNGGPTETHALLPDSPAINRGSLTDDSFDQRGVGFNRFISGKPDIGAFELQSNSLGSVISVVNLQDSGPGSLRDAIHLANVTLGYEQIRFDVTGTISLNSTLEVTDGLTITGPGADLLTLDGGNGVDGVFATGDGFGVFELNSLSQRIELSGMTITGGDSNIGGGVWGRGWAGVLISDARIVGNAAGIRGGGVSTFQNVTIESSEISSNWSRNGGGLFASGLAPLVIANSTISGNTATRYGGGFAVRGKSYISNSEISGNLASSGAGAYIYSNPSRDFVDFLNTTISGNHATYNGGGTLALGPIRLRHSTLTLNSACGRGGMLNLFNESIIANSIVAGNESTCVGGDPDADQIDLLWHSILGKPDFRGRLADRDGLFGSLVGSPDGLDPLLAPLQDNGGETATHSLLPSSPALNAGDAEYSAPPLFDQRGDGYRRVSGEQVDMGAFEVQVILPCDLNGDGICQGTDIDLLQQNLVNGTSDPTVFDLNIDGLVDLDDRDLWLQLAGMENLGSGDAYQLGDANLDGVVDGADFQIWSAHKFTSDSAWTHGDFTADGFVSGRDFLVWNQNKAPATSRRPVGGRPRPYLFSVESKIRREHRLELDSVVDLIFSDKRDQ